jgi:hypothetical protein
MGVQKAVKKQAITAERFATQTADAFVANQMKTLADAFRAQAKVMALGTLKSRLSSAESRSE